MLYSLPWINQSNKNFSCGLLSLFSWISYFFFLQNTWNVWTKVITELWMIFLWNVDRIFVSDDFFFSFQVHLFIFEDSWKQNFTTLFYPDSTSIRFCLGKSIPYNTVSESWWSTHGSRETSRSVEMCSRWECTFRSGSVASKAGRWWSFFLSSGALLSKSIKSE